MVRTDSKVAGFSSSPPLATRLLCPPLGGVTLNPSDGQFSFTRPG
jgi:hypothetical protein